MKTVRIGTNHSYKCRSNNTNGYFRNVDCLGTEHKLLECGYVNDPSTCNAGGGCNGSLRRDATVSCLLGNLIKY